MAKNKKQLNKISGNSKDVWGEKLEKLQQEFPEVLSENEVDCDQLKRLVGDDNVAEGERYSFSWAGKSKAFQEIKRQTTKTLKPDREESVDFDNTDNLFIEGENLEVLKILQKSYHNKVKMIYIDPPYNTGKDFIYNDDFRRTKDEEEKEAGNKDEEGKIKQGLVKNTKDKGHYHSNWLNMMYPRLYLARNLLREDGVIFVSIDDNEVHNLRMIMNEIFGEENFLGVIKRRAARKTAHLSQTMSDLCDYVIVYSKSRLNSPLSVEDVTEKTRPVFNSGNKIVSRIIPVSTEARCGDGYYKKGLYKVRSLEFELLSDLVIKNGKTKKEVIIKGPFRVNQKLLNKNVYITSNFGLRRYVTDKELEKSKVMHDLIDNPDLYNEMGSEELKEIFDDVELFNNPKPVNFVKFLLSSLSEEEEFIVLDFFGGSGTTSHAVMEQNAEDGGNRKYIIVQLPEETDKDSEARKAGYKTIADIAKARVSRAGEMIEKKVGEIHSTMNYMEDKEGQSPKNIKEYFSGIKGMKHKSDTGFKVFKLVDSNFKQWIREEVKDKEKLQQKLEDSIENLDKDSKEGNIIFELMLKLGIDPNVSVEDKKDYFVVDERELIICLEDKITKKIIDKIIEEEPNVFVCLDSVFDGNDELKTNTSLQMKSKEIEFKVI